MGRKVLHDGSTLHDRDAFIYGGALTLMWSFTWLTVSPCCQPPGALPVGWRHEEVPYHGGWASSSSSTDTPHGTDGYRRHEANILRTFSHGGDMSLSEGAETICGIVRRTAVSAHPFRVNVAKQLW